MTKQKLIDEILKTVHLDPEEFSDGEILDIIYGLVKKEEKE